VVLEDALPRPALVSSETRAGASGRGAECGSSGFVSMLLRLIRPLSLASGPASAGPAGAVLLDGQRPGRCFPSPRRGRAHPRAGGQGIPRGQVVLPCGGQWLGPGSGPPDAGSLVVAALRSSAGPALLQCQAKQKRAASLHDLPSAPVLTARSLLSLRRIHLEQARRVSWLVHRPPVGAGMIRLAKLWLALRLGPWSLRWPMTRLRRHGQEEIKHVRSQTAGVLLALESAESPSCLSTSVVRRRGKEVGFVSKSALAARLPAASRWNSGAGRKFRRGEISAAQPNLEELPGKPRRTEWHPSAGGEC
jgi:hypothetical protein